MLKIKNNVDLKELEKFGMNYTKDEETKEEWLDFPERVTLDSYYFDKSKYLVDEYGYPLKDKDLETLYNLIKADLVEKVED
jgi:hypothetical protein